MPTPSPHRSQPTPVPGYPGRSSSTIPPASVMPDPSANYSWNENYPQGAGHSQINPMLQTNTSFHNHASSSSSSYYPTPGVEQPNTTQSSPPSSFPRAGAETPMRYHWVMQFLDPHNSFPPRHTTVDTGRFQVPVIGCSCGMQIQILYLPAFTLEPNCLNRQNILPLWNFRGMGNSGNLWIEGPNFQQTQCLSEQRCPHCGTCLRVLLQPVTPQLANADNSLMNLGYP